MNAYLDSSVLLRVALRSPDSLPEWSAVKDPVSSTLLRLECARTLERRRLSENVPLPEIARSREAIELLTANIELIALTEQVLERAATAFAVPLKTLDAIHLATALLWREKNQTDLAFATHDTTLARAARAAGFEVLGA